MQTQEPKPVQQYVSRPSQVYINGQKAINKMREIRIIDGTMYAPFRAFLETLGAQVVYDERTQIILTRKGNISIIIDTAKKAAFVNAKKIMMKSEIVIIDDITYVPVRFVCESFNGTVNWNRRARTVYITIN
jgi:hypothetical protein